MSDAIDRLRPRLLAAAAVMTLACSKNEDEHTPATKVADDMTSAPAASTTTPVVSAAPIEASVTATASSAPPVATSAPAATTAPHQRKNLPRPFIHVRI